jgi:hypothetical protein
MMAVLILLTAVLVVIVRQSAYAGRVPRRLIYAALVLPAVGLLLSVFLSGADKRTRIDVRFAGYRIPLNEVRDCKVTQDPSPAASGSVAERGGLTTNRSIGCRSQVIAGISPTCAIQQTTNRPR